MRKGVRRENKTRIKVRQEGQNKKERERVRKKTRHHEKLLIRGRWADVRKDKQFVPSLINRILWKDLSTCDR